MMSSRFNFDILIPEDEMFPYEDANACSSCASLTSESARAFDKNAYFFKNDFGTVIHNSWTDLVRSAESGCRLCALFRKSLQDRILTDMDEDAKNNVPLRVFRSDPGQTKVFSGVNSSMLTLEIRPPGSGTIFSCQIGLYKDRGDTTNKQVTEYRLSRRPNIDVICRIIRTWMKKGTRAARHQNHSPSLPRRVIDVSGDLELIKLVDVHDGFKANYICLSHRWGGTNPITTTQDTLQLRLRGVLLSELTQTFQDAVAITRNLGIHYLWIDSLCVLQDSKTDWEIESAKMGSYYGSSWLTIGAGMEEDGIFVPRNLPSEPYIKIHPSNSGALYLARKVNDLPLRGIGDINQSPLYSRGWTLQEEMLSPRFLSFEPTQTFFRNELSILSECGEWKGLNQWKSLGRKQMTNWARVVEDYSSRALSVESDRLPALSGLAQEYSATTNQTYIAGIWKEDFWKQLLWKAKTPKRPKTYIGPSWSWVSVVSEVTFMGTRYTDSRIELMQVQIEHCSSNEFGQIKSAFLEVFGTLATFELKRHILDLSTYSTEEEAATAFDQDASELRLFLYKDGLSCGQVIPDEEIGAEVQWVRFLYVTENGDGIVLLPVDEEGFVCRRIGAATVRHGEAIEKTRVDVRIV